MGVTIAVNTKNDMKGFFFKANKWQMNRCLAPGMTCEKTAIRAHSIQNARVLDLLCKDDHVVGPVKRIDKDKGPQIDFDMIGRNKASTFTGLCSDHDTKLFLPIDINRFDPSSDEHLFLIAYRAVVRELHAVMDGAIKIQSAYKKRVQVGWDNDDIHSPAGMLGVEHMMKAYQTHIYKKRFDSALSLSQFDHISHRLIRLTHERPTIGVGALYSADDFIVDNDVLRLSLNVIPMSQTETVVVFSYPREHSTLAQAHLDRVLLSDASYQKYELSKIILNSCENFVLSPDYFSSWSEAKTSAVVDYFVHTLFKNDTVVESEYIYLF